MVNSYAQFKDVIKGNSLKHFQKLLWEIEQDPTMKLPKQLTESVKRIMEADSSKYDPALAEELEKVWLDKFIRNAYDVNWSRWQIPQGTDFFFEHAGRLGDPEYKPNGQDVIRARPQEQAKSYKDREFRVWLPQGLKQVFIYDPEKPLAELLQETKKLHNIDEQSEYNAWIHSTGAAVENLNVPLSSLSCLEIYFYPLGRSPPVGGASAPRRTLQATKERRGEEKSTLSMGVKKRDEEVLSGTFQISVCAMQDLSNINPYYDALHFTLSNNQNPKQFKSFPVPNDPFPEWENPIKIQVNRDYLECTLVVWATNKVSHSDTLLGECTGVFSKFSDGDQRFGIWKLKKEPKRDKKDKDKAGEVLFRWKYWDKKRKADLPNNAGGRLSEAPRGAGSVLRLPTTLNIPTPTESERSDSARDSGRDSKQELDSERQDSSRSVSPKRESKSNHKRGHNKRDKEKSSARIAEETVGGLEDNYTLGEQLGTGAFSVVKAAVHKKTGFKCAVKILDNYSNLVDAEEEMESFQRETSIMQMLKHDNIVRLMDVFEDQEHYYVVMECVAGGELFDQILAKGFYPEEEAKILIQQVFSALAYMHSKDIAHRDIKPENLLFSDNTYSKLKLVDFGESKAVGDGLKDYCGTPDYMAPELLKGQIYTQLVDTWAMGVVSFIMLCGFPPFDGDTETDVLCNIMNLEYDFPSPEWDEKTDESKDFVRSLMSEAEQRNSASQALGHPWLQRT